MHVIKIVGLVNGKPTPVDGQWLVEYDPTRRGVGPSGQPMTAHVVCSTDPAKARRFAGAREALECWRADSGRTRPDGCPDRPLTAYFILIEEEPQPATCARCTSKPATGPCCTSHNQPLCHGCYRATHFVEVCVPNCPDCAREGLDPATPAKPPIAKAEPRG